MTQEANQAHLAVVGAGAWGTVLAIMLARNGHSVTLWARRRETAREIRRSGQNRRRLPDVPVPPSIVVTSDLSEAVSGAQAVFLAVPSSVVAELAQRLPAASTIISCSKGFSPPGLTTLSSVIAAALPHSSVAVLTGPNLSGEIAAGLPAAAVAASGDPDAALRTQGWLQSASFRVYTSPDPTGAEVGGAFKNVIALASGIADGLGLGDNAKASIMTRGLAEMVRLGTDLGGRRETFYGLSGVGDMVATCSSRASRNHAAGVRIAGGATARGLAAEGVTAEGIRAARLVHEYATDRGLPLPICREVYRVAFEGRAPRDAIDELMTRASGPEW